MPDQQLSVLGLGIVTDGYANIRDLAKIADPPPSIRTMLEQSQTLDAAQVDSHDPLSQLALRSLHQAWTMAQLSQVNTERIGLIFVSAWGNIDATTGYLESMLDADGRFASPRHFSRSVYSSGASIMAIEHAIKGPCETLSFDADPARGRGAVDGALTQAWRFLATGRCDRVVIVWADQCCDLATDLARRASQHLHQHSYDRYVKDGLGYGAVAVVVGPSKIGGVPLSLPLDPVCMRLNHRRGKPFPMDAAVSFLESFVRRSSITPPE